MKKSSLFIGAVFLFLSVVLLTPSPAAAQKIGFVNVEEVLITSAAGKAANEDLKKIFEKNKQAIENREKELQRLKDELEKQRPVLKEKVLRDKEASYQKKFRDYQDLVKDANDEMQARRQELFAKNIPEILKIINAIGEKEQYTAIIDTSTVPVAYFNKDQNLTKRVLEEFDKAYGAKK
ncbi:MAG TPA: OmpH family outer membrane protein [Syntrophales bacterium]|nr:OmpH family outer membrane protein [Syntrophales bacterium]HOM06170.1 OmpH family outer membrane protein [Syntrophales bacterium]HON98966.1 OmpH family outer membrane protein [Syntrophales bacterium]HPC01024.1 OmpH family outer membrane protein [Syntrophales bacterium]HPQ05653.1 OmpH family outer membrane protein [Syntrophales bacterium]